MHKKGIIIISAVAFIGGCIYSWLFIIPSLLGNDNTTTDEPNSQVVELPTSVVSAKNYADKLGDSGQINDALSEYDKAIASAKDNYSKAYLLQSKATVYFNNRDYDNALETAKKADELSNSSASNYLIARVYEEKGDKDSAVLFYKKAIELVDEEDPVAGDDIQYYQDKIRRLELNEGTAQ